MLFRQRNLLDLNLLKLESTTLFIFKWKDWFWKLNLILGSQGRFIGEKTGSNSQFSKLMHLKEDISPVVAIRSCLLILSSYSLYHSKECGLETDLQMTAHSLQKERRNSWVGAHLQIRSSCADMEKKETSTNFSSFSLIHVYVHIYARVWLCAVFNIYIIYLYSCTYWI